MREADPIGFLSDVMRGKPIEELDWEGEFVGYARPSMDHRVVAARELLKKVVPDLKSVDVTAADNAGITFNFESPIPLPHSQPVKTITVDADAAADQITDAILTSVSEVSDD